MEGPVTQVGESGHEKILKKIMDLWPRIQMRESSHKKIKKIEKYVTKDTKGGKWS